MKSTWLTLTAALLCAHGAQAQFVTPVPIQALQAERPAALPAFPSFPQLVSRNEGLPPDDPLARYLYRFDPKLYARIDVNPYLGFETTLTNPRYTDVPRYVGSEPRLAQGAPIGVGGINIDVAARLTIPVDDRFSVFGKLGVSVEQRTHQAADQRNSYDVNAITTTTSLGPAASVGARYKLDKDRTATAEVLLGAPARRELNGTASGIGTKLKLDF